MADDFPPPFDAPPYAAEAGRLANWLSRRYQLETADVRQQLALILIERGSGYDPAKCTLFYFLFGYWRKAYSKPICRERRRTFVPLVLDRGDTRDDYFGALPDKGPGPAELAEINLDAAVVVAALAGLGDRDRAAVRMVFGLDGAAPMTRAAAGDELGVSRARAGDLARRGIQELRRRFR